MNTGSKNEAVHSKKEETEAQSLFGPGKPMIVTFPASQAAAIWAKEIAYGKMIDPIEIDLELNDHSGIVDAFNSTAPDAFVVMTDVGRASEENVKAVLEVIKDEGRTIFVTGNKIPAGLKPHDFAHWYKR